MQREYKISLSQEYYSDVVYLSQYDDDYDVIFHVINKYSAADVGGKSAKFTGTRTDGFGFTFNAVAVGSSVSFHINTSLTACAGTHTAEIIFYSNDGLYFGSANVQVIVEKAAHPDGTIDADEEQLRELAEQVQEIVDTAAAEVKGEAESWAVGERDGEPVPSTDPTYHNNAKYYAEQAQEIADSIGIDATLSISGKAADAKKTGDEISSLKEDLSDLLTDKVVEHFDASFVQNRALLSNGVLTESTSNAFVHSAFLDLGKDAVITIATGYKIVAWDGEYDEFGHAVTYVYDGWQEGTANYTYRSAYPYLMICVTKDGTQTITPSEATEAVTITHTEETIFAKKADLSDLSDLSTDIDQLKEVLNEISEHPNLLPKTSGTKSIVNNSVSTAYSNGHYTCVGTSTGDGGRTNHLIEFTLSAGTYTVSAHNVSKNNKSAPRVFLQDASNSILAYLYSETAGDNTKTFTLANSATLNIGTGVVSAEVYDFSCDLEVVSGETAATEYVPPTGSAVDLTARKLIPLVADLEGDTSELDARVENLEEGRTLIIPTWNENYYISNHAHGISALNTYYYSDSIELSKGEGIKVIDAYSSDTGVVDMLSRWTSDGNYDASIYAYAQTGYSDSALYRATAAKEYIRVCSKHDANVTPDKIKVCKYPAPAVDRSGEISALQELTIIPSIAMFERVGFCGDSYVKGQIYGTNGVIGDFPNLSWGKDIGRMDGITADIFAFSGADTHSWQTLTNCLPALLASENPCGLYVFCMGINDSSYVTLGSMDDITDYDDYSDYPNTFYGNYGRIIERVLNYSADSKIIIMTPYHPDYNDRYVTPITEITEHYGIAMIDTNDSALCSSADFKSMLVGGHPTAVLHSAMARDISNLIGKCLNDYYSYFKDYVGISTS